MSEEFPAQPTTAATFQLIRKQQLLVLLQMSNSTLHEKLKPGSRYYDPSLPKPIYFNGGRTPRWRLADVEEWIATAVSAGKTESSGQGLKKQRAESVACGTPQADSATCAPEPQLQGGHRAAPFDFVVRKRRPLYAPAQNARPPTLLPPQRR